MYMYLCNNNHKNASFLPLPKSYFLVLSILPKELCLEFNLLKLNQICRNLNKFLTISGNFETIKKADHILEMPEHKVFCYNHLRILLRKLDLRRKAGQRRY